MTSAHESAPSSTAATSAPRTAEAAADLAADLGAQDVLLFRRVRRGEWFHIDGVGRGAGWAGIVIADEVREPVLEQALTGGASVRVLSSTPTRIVGPFLAGTAVVLHLGTGAGAPGGGGGPDGLGGTGGTEGSDGSDAGSIVAVWGHPARSQRLLAATDEELRRASLTILAAADSSSPTRRLSEELEVLNVVQELTSSLDSPLQPTLERVAAVVRDALACRSVLAWVGGHWALVGEDALALGSGGDLRAGGVETGPDAAQAPVPSSGSAAVPSSGPSSGPSTTPPTGPFAATPVGPEPSAAALLEALNAVAPRPGDPPLVVAAAGAGALPEPFGAAPGYAVVALDVPTPGGVLAVLPRARPAAADADRLAVRILTQVGAAASSLVSVALARSRLEEQLTATRARLGQDALTEAASRHRWDEEIERAQLLVDEGVPVAVALLDLDDLKWVNDTHGHPAGDALLQACARAVRGVLRGGSDVVARVGGDEFAVLVPRATDIEALTARLRSIDGSTTPEGLALRVSLGLARCLPGERVADAFAEADAAMYADKRRRRAVRGAAAAARESAVRDGATGGAGERDGGGPGEAPADGRREDGPDADRRDEAEAS